jgi:DNA-binding transcriptional LysR family regulator
VPPVNLNQLRVFEAVGRTGSFSRAAEALGVTQPAVTVQIRRLEDCAEPRSSSGCGAGRA